MKTGRNDPCPCGSGKKHKRCCLSGAQRQHSDLLDEFEQMIAMNPNLTLEELNAVAAQRMRQTNQRPEPDFCGLTPHQMANWLHAPADALTGLTIITPDDLSTSPVMRYLALILDIALQNGGSFKATSKGNLPLQLVMQANSLRDELLIGYSVHISIDEFSGSNEDAFNALHYTRVLAEEAGIIYRRGGRYHFKKTAQKQYERHGIGVFFRPMLECATYRYNWAYLDGWEYDSRLRMFWVFMVWRLQLHRSVDRLVDEMTKAFPDLLRECEGNPYRSPTDMLGVLIEVRFIQRFLQFWGFVRYDSMQRHFGEREPLTVKIQPLMTQTFQFSLS